MRQDGIRAKTVKKWRGHHLVDSPVPGRGEQAQMEISEYLEVFYNRRRRDPTLGYCSPAEFEARTAVA
jgi:transposase InsO family protein